MSRRRAKGGQWALCKRFFYSGIRQLKEVSEIIKAVSWMQKNLKAVPSNRGSVNS